MGIFDQQERANRDSSRKHQASVDTFTDELKQDLEKELYSKASFTDRQLEGLQRSWSFPKITLEKPPFWKRALEFLKRLGV
jgi:hypothetical protein